MITAASALGTDWPQLNLDPQHNGAGHQETTIHTSNDATLHPAYPAVSLPVIDSNRQFVYSYGLDARVPKYQVSGRRCRRRGGRAGPRDQRQDSPP